MNGFSFAVLVLEQAAKVHGASGMAFGLKKLPVPHSHPIPQLGTREFDSRQQVSGVRSGHACRRVHVLHCGTYGSGVVVESIPVVDSRELQMERDLLGRS